MRILETGALEVRHRIGLQPDDVVLDPEALVLKHRPDTEDVVVGADDPDGAIVLQDALALGEPLVREQIIIVKAGELVPLVVNAVDDRLVRAGQPAAELQVVWRVRKHEIDRLVGNPRQEFDTVTLRDRVLLDGHSGGPAEIYVPWNLWVVPVTTALRKSERKVTASAARLLPRLQFKQELASNGLARAEEIGAQCRPLAAEPVARRGLLEPL